MVFRRLRAFFSRASSNGPVASSAPYSRLASIWNQYVPASAVAVQMRHDHVRYLHPTKGWRSVSKRRLGIS